MNDLKRCQNITCTFIITKQLIPGQLRWFRPAPIHHRLHIEPAHELLNPERVLIEHIHTNLRRVLADRLDIPVQTHLVYSQRLIPRRIHRVVNSLRRDRLRVQTDPCERVRTAGYVQHEHVAALVQIGLELEEVALVEEDFGGQADGVDVLLRESVTSRKVIS